MRPTTCLFGGALFAAGLSPPAGAQQFVFVDVPAFTTSLQAYASDLPGIGSFDAESDHNSSPATAVSTVSASYAGFTASASFGLDAFDLRADTRPAYGAGVAFARGYAYFTTASPSDMIVTWDFADEFPPFAFMESAVSVRDVTGPSVTLLEINTDADAPDAGHAVIPLEPGRTYRFDAEAWAFEPGGPVSVHAELAAGCPADCDGNDEVNLDDIDCFANAFLAGDLGLADADANGTLNFDDIDAFVASFLGGC